MDEEMLIKEEMEIMDMPYVDLDTEEENKATKAKKRTSAEQKDPLAPSEVVSTEIKKNMSGQPVCKKQRMLIVNLFKSMLGKGEKQYIKDICMEISQQTGISIWTIASIWRDFQKTGEVKGPNTTRRRTTISQRLDDRVKDAIRNKIKWFNDNCETISIYKLLSAVNNDPELPRFSRGTFHRIFHDYFKYTIPPKKSNNKTAANGKATNSAATSSKAITNSTATTSKAITNSTVTTSKAITNSTTTIAVSTKDITNSVKKKRIGPLKLDENFDRSLIRKKIHGFYLNGELPTLSKILDVVNKDPELPNFTCVALHSLLMNHLYFTSTKKRRDNILTENDDLVLWRRGYLRQMKAYRAEGRPIYYLYQTSVHAEIPPNLDLWVDNSMPSCLIISHICSDSGFVPGGLFCFEYEKKAKDDHRDMYGETFQEWFQSILPTLSDNCVIAMDNALYQAMQAKRIPNAFWKKTDIIQWLTDKGISLEPDLLKTELLRCISDSDKETYERHLDGSVKGNKTTIIRVPPHHSELNPVERLWFIMKQYIKTQDSAFTLGGIKHFVDEDVERIIGTEWTNFICLVRQEEEKLWIVDEVVEKLTDGVSVAPILMDDKNTTVAESASDLELTDDFDFDLF